MSICKIICYIIKGQIVNPSSFPSVLSFHFVYPVGRIIDSGHAGQSAGSEEAIESLMSTVSHKGEWRLACGDHVASQFALRIDTSSTTVIIYVGTTQPGIDLSSIVAGFYYMAGKDAGIPII